MSGLAYRHQRVQRLRKLASRRAFREEEGCFVLEGVNLLEEALAAGTSIEAVFVDPKVARPSAPSAPPAAGAEGRKLINAPGPGDAAEASEAAEPGCTPGPGDGVAAARLQELLGRCYDAGARVFELEEGVLARVAGTVTPQPVMAVAQIPRCQLSQLGEAAPHLVVVCVDVRDPGNAGTVARSAWAAGADGLVCCQGTVDMWNPKTVRASAGAILHLPVVSAGPAAEVLDQLGAWGLARWGTVVDGGQDYALADLSGPVALVLGNEAAGLDVEALAGHLDGLVSIPMTGGAESLNVGTAAAVLCFEVARQRRLGTMVTNDARSST